jgi:hypothetical protein
MSDTLPKSVKQDQRILRVELFGSSRAECGAISVQGDFPVLKLCRQLMRHGFDPSTALYCYRGKTLCLIVRSISEGAALEVAGDGVGFIVRRRRSLVGMITDMLTAPPIRKNEQPDQRRRTRIDAPSEPRTTAE